MDKNFFKRYEYTEFKTSDHENINSDCGFTITLPTKELVTDTTESYVIHKENLFNIASEVVVKKLKMQKSI